MKRYPIELALASPHLKKTGPSNAQPQTSLIDPFRVADPRETRVPRALLGATVMSDPATPGFEKLKDTYVCRASRPTETSRPHCPVMG